MARRRQLRSRRTEVTMMTEVTCPELPKNNKGARGNATRRGRGGRGLDRRRAPRGGDRVTGRPRGLPLATEARPFRPERSDGANRVRCSPVGSELSAKLVLVPSLNLLISMFRYSQGRTLPMSIRPGRPPTTGTCILRHIGGSGLPRKAVLSLHAPKSGFSGQRNDYRPPASGAGDDASARSVVVAEVVR